MGCFGYICKHCNTPVRGDCFEGGEKCVLIHVRHGEELGRVVGHYNEYGTVFGADETDAQRFMGTEGANSRRGIHESEYRLDDSIGRYDQLRFYQGAWRTYTAYLKLRASAIEDIEKSEVFSELSDYQSGLVDKFSDAETRRMFAEYGVAEHWERKCEFLGEFWALPEYKSVEGLAKSGVVAYHHKCYNAAVKAGTFNLLPSDPDPNQSCGKVRKKFK